MNLWLTSHFLVVGLFVCSAAPTPEECSQLVSPVSLDDCSRMFGSWNFLVGYSDSELFNNILKVTDSSTVQIKKNSDGVLKFSEYNKMNGKCISSVANVTVDGDTATVSSMNVTSVFHVLSSSDDCLVFNINSTVGDIDQIMSVLNISVSGGEEAVVRSLYLMGRESTVKDSDLEHFKHQAICLGFSREPDFYHDSKKEFCTEAESIKIFS
ncbi:saxitoxin and tetrodotoxin-binding protein 1-like [Paralichthys olivaceus]|uniref:Tributyltin binding protein type 1 n=2 Tax=Paralichthys olivaceus TaxID=8255 RepID=Q1XG02_PAROL|nr:PREDICTED: saxitoxin and tetrodotoxin-binding protein 1-like [Paralichthys olivaceus]BAE92861.1 tributyltin binding protein type 1 [Paralichthys olivaceus]